MRKPRERAGTVFGDWTITENLGVGGNGEAWLAENTQGDLRVVKVLTRRGGDSYERFRREVETVQEVVGLGYAVLPIDEVHLPERPTSKNKPFFVMPQAERIDKALVGAELTTKVAAVAALAETLARLAQSHDLHHRDVKPSNLYRYAETFVLGDFGLVKTADDPDLTADEQIVGPWNFLPSEVFNPRSPIDWERVDVHCLAMSLWCLIVESEHPPRRIDPEEETSLAAQLDVPEAHSSEDLTAAHSRTYVQELDQILARATAPTPSRRPSLDEFARQLRDWIASVKFRDEFQSYVERAQDDERRMLRWLVNYSREDVTLGRPMFDLDDPEAPSEVDGLTNARFYNALEGLKDRFLIEGEHEVTAGGRGLWWKVYPASYGVEEVLGHRELEAEVLPIARQLAEGQRIDVIEISGDDEWIDFRRLRLSPPNLYFLLRYMREKNLVDYNEQYASGNTALLLSLRLTSHGRNWAAARGQ